MWLVVMLIPFLTFAQFKPHVPIPLDIDLRPAVKEKPAPSPFDLDKINSSEIKKPINFDTLLETINEIDRLLEKTREQIASIRSNK